MFLGVKNEKLETLTANFQVLVEATFPNPFKNFSKLAARLPVLFRILQFSSLKIPVRGRID